MCFDFFPIFLVLPLFIIVYFIGTDTVPVMDFEEKLHLYLAPAPIVTLLGGFRQVF